MKEEIVVFGQQAINKILELYRDEGIKCLSLTDRGTLLAKVHPGMSREELDYVLTSTRYYLSSVCSKIRIIIER